MIRRARADEHELVTEISFRSKKYWDYPTHYFDIWHKELTLSPQYILQNDVFVIEVSESIVGYYSLIELKSNIYISKIMLEAGHWLEHMFLLPSFIGNGLGRELFIHCIKTCKEKSIAEIKILSDPNAKGFYIKMGCNYIDEYPSTIAGRTTPYLTLQLDKIP